MSERPPRITIWQAFRLICRMEWQRFRGKMSPQGLPATHPLAAVQKKFASRGRYVWLALGMVFMFTVMTVFGFGIGYAYATRALFFETPPGMILVTKSEGEFFPPYDWKDELRGQEHGETQEKRARGKRSKRAEERKLILEERGTPQDKRPRPMTAEEKKMLDDWVEKGGPAPYVRADRFPVQATPNTVSFAWPVEAQAHTIARALSVFGGLLVLCLVVFPWGSGLRRLGSAGWGLEWLASLPVPTPALFLARVVGGTLSDVAVWVVLWPGLLGILIALGHFWLTALALSLLLAAAWGLLACAVRETLESAFRRSWPASRLRNLEGLCAILGYIAPVALVAVINLGGVAGKWIGFSVKAGAWLTMSPWYGAFLPAAAGGAWTGLAVAWLWTGGVLALGVWLVTRWTRGGLLAGGGFVSVPQDSAPALGESRLSPMVRKEFLLLKRDRAYLARTIIVPLIAVGLQFLMNTNERMLSSALPWLAENAALLSYLLGAYIVAIAGYELLAREGTSVWLLYTFPRSLTEQLRQKARAWIAISGSFAVLCFLAIGFMAHFSWANWLRMPFVLAAVAVNGYVAGALGIIGVKNLGHLERPRLRLGYYWIFNVLTGGLGAAIYAGDLWLEISQVCIVGFTAYALWDKAADREVSLLDPTAPLPRKLYLAEVLIALAIFLSIAGSILGVAMSLGGVNPLWSSILYLTVGGVVAIFIARHFSERSDLLAEAAERLGPRKPVEQALGYALPAAGIAIAIGLIYQWLMRAFGPDLPAMEVSAAIKWGLALAVVVGAPLFEEYLFRGLLYPLLRERWSPTKSALVSAVFFAALHSGYAAIPVFCVGLILAHVREKTNRLEACIAVHALYNFAMLISA